jgi:uncharacterized protein
VDKRGVGESDGDLRNATTTDLAKDAEAGLAYVATRAEVDAGRIGMVGHSEGGLIACMLAARNRGVAFIVLMAAPGVPGWELAGQQARRSAEIHGVDPEGAEQRNIEVRALLRDEKDEAVLRRKLHQRFSDIPEPHRSEAIKTLTLPWHRHFADLNPADYLGRVNCPHVSDDNPFSKAHFKTMKYRPGYPDRFGSIQQARRFSQEFFPWNNHQHHQSGRPLETWKA